LKKCEAFFVCGLEPFHHRRTGVDILVSWNFKYIVNVFRIRGYNSINLQYGYSQLDIRSPKEIVNNEEGN
jgi:hypothetical protein